MQNGVSMTASRYTWVYLRQEQHLGRINWHDSFSRTPQHLERRPLAILEPIVLFGMDSDCESLLKHWRVLFAIALPAICTSPALEEEKLCGLCKFNAIHDLMLIRGPVVIATVDTVAQLCGTR